MDAISKVHRYVAGKTVENYVVDDYMRSAVERQLQIIGEALNGLSRLDPEAAARVPDLSQIVAFRNIVVHGYAVLDHARVWALISERLTPLKEALREVSE